MKYCNDCRKLMPDHYNFCPECGKAGVLLEEKNIGDTIEIGEWDGIPIEWLIVNIYEQDKKVLLLSKYALFQKEYHTKWESVTWERCTLRHYLQTEFIQNGFVKQQDREKILPVRNQNAENSTYHTSGGNTSWDKVFLLSIDEFQRYMDKGKTLYCYRDVQNRKGGRVAWWLRSPGDNVLYAAVVSSDGALIEIGRNVRGGYLWVRPAFYYNLKS